MDEKLDKFKNSINEKPITLERKDPTASMESHSVKNSPENDQRERHSIHDQRYQPSYHFQIMFLMKIDKQDNENMRFSKESILKDGTVV